MLIPASVRLTPMMRRFVELRFDEGLTQREIACPLKIKQPAVSRREARIRDRFAAAGEPEPDVPGRGLINLDVVSRGLIPIGTAAI